MTSVERVAYLELLPHFQAEQKIQAGQYDPENPDQVFALFMVAYGDVERAEMERLHAQQRLIGRTCPTSTRG